MTSVDETLSVARRAPAGKNVSYRYEIDPRHVSVARTETEAHSLGVRARRRGGDRQEPTREVEVER